MRYTFLLAQILLFCININAQTSKQDEKFRVIIMTDMTHDDGNSLIRYLYYTPYFDTEAIIVTPQLPDYNYNNEAPWSKVTNILNAYKQEYPQLKKHDPNFPEVETISRVTKRGRGALPIIWLTNEKKFAGKIAGRPVESSWGDIDFHDWIGEGKNPNGEPKDSDGSEYLQEVFQKNDDRPIFVQMWGGPITFVQALYRYKQRNGDEKFQQLMKKIHVFGILLQDITFDYLIDLDKVKKLSCDNMGSTTSTYKGERVHPGWLLNDAGHFWRYITVMKDTEVKGHGAMSQYYDHGGEGDTPAFLYLLSAKLGLNDPLDPTQGSWGSMFRPMSPEFPKNYFETCRVDKNELERWIQPARNSFMNRLQYSLKDPDRVNHEPVAAINGDKGNGIINLLAKPNETVTLDGSASSDPDDDQISFRWFFYKEASDYTGSFTFNDPSSAKQTLTVPQDIGKKNIHIILEVVDKGTPELVSYRRVILSAK